MGKRIPSVKGLPFVGNLFHLMLSGGTSHKTHVYFKNRWQMLGPMFKEKLGRYEAVFLHDPNDVKNLLHQEGSYPRRTEFPAWKMYREESGYASGIILL